MADNVFILGAGFSHAAGIPLMAGFVDTMLDIARRGTLNGNHISHEDVDVVRRAMKIRDELDVYHGRARLDDRNIEDILSILAFNVMGGGQKEKEKLDSFSKAIAVTIRLCTTIRDPRYPGGGANVIEDEPSLYRRFWYGVLDWANSHRRIPAIITFNYDLVLELSLLQALNNTHFNQYDRRLAYDGVIVNSFGDSGPDFAFRIKQTLRHYERQETLGSALVPCEVPENKSNFLRIDILRLHGSIGLSKPRQKADVPAFASPVEDPFIVPPISNKISTSSIEKVWSQALRQLRDAKKVTVVGYSLPPTDVYVQYFLRAALGPNKDLDQITVFNPVLWEADNTMARRYLECFSEQLCRRIKFTPTDSSQYALSGTTDHFVNVLEESPATLLW